MAQQQSVAIIGGGVVGLALSRELARAGYEVFLFEQDEHFGSAQSSRNSGVIHPGIPYRPRSLKAILCVLGRRMLYDFCREHQVPFLKTGELMIARDEMENQELDFYLLRGLENGVEGLQKIARSKLKEMEPNIEGYSALYSPETGIIDAGEYIKVLVRLADDAGAQLLCRKVVGIGKRGSGFELRMVDMRAPEEKQEIESMEFDWVVNAAGVYADEVAAMIKPDRNVAYKIIPVRGEYYWYSSTKRPELAIRHCIYGLPTRTPMPSGGTIFGLGMHLVPTLDTSLRDSVCLSDIVLVGPSTKGVCHKEDYASNLYPPEYFLSAMKPVLPSLELGDLKEGYAGIRAELFGCDDVVICHDESFQQFINIFGSKSPCLTASLAIAPHILFYIKNRFFPEHS